jgi:alkyl sulfatase BDS1-like metallo-beta-lactamase superfamily hydrolase
VCRFAGEQDPVVGVGEQEGDAIGARDPVEQRPEVRAPDRNDTPKMSQAKYHKGLHDLGQGCHAWLQHDGGWGWSNVGLITGSGTSLLVDTLFDLNFTAEMLAVFAPVTDRHPLATLVNTHSDTDHFFGNELVAAQGV